MKTISSRYVAEEVPLEEDRVYFKEEEGEEIDTLREVRRKKQLLMKKSGKASKYWHDGSLSPRRTDKMPTVVRRRNYIDQMDPTS